MKCRLGGWRLMLWAGDASHGKHEKKYSLLVVKTLPTLGTRTSQWLLRCIHERNMTEISVRSLRTECSYPTGYIDRSFISSGDDDAVSITLRYLRIRNPQLCGFKVGYCVKKHWWYVYICLSVMTANYTSATNGHNYLNSYGVFFHFFLNFLTRILISHDRPNWLFVRSFSHNLTFYTFIVSYSIYYLRVIPLHNNCHAIYLLTI